MINIHPDTLIIRTDASSAIGTGHLMRCLALAEAWKDRGGSVIFILATSSLLIEERLTSEAMEIKHIIYEPGSSADAYETVRIAQDREAKWIVADGYHFRTEYQRIIKNSGLSLLFIDDYGHADHYYADIVLNQNIYADMSFYKKFEPYTRFLLGTNYVLIRREFLNLAGYKRDIPDIARTVLVTLGGGDPDNVTHSVIEALKKTNIDRLEVIAVVGGVNPHYEMLLESVQDRSGFSIQKNVTNMPELMMQADIVISAGGSTCWEVAFIGLPNLIIVIAENQRLIAEALHSAGVARNLGFYNKISKEKLLEGILAFIDSTHSKTKVLVVGSGLVDGRGGSRVIAEMMKTRGGIQ